MAKVSMKFGSLTSASTPGGSGGGSSIQPASGGGGEPINIESVAELPETIDPQTIYLVQGNVWVAEPSVITNQKFASVEHLPPDPDPNVLFMIRKR